MKKLFSSSQITLATTVFFGLSGFSFAEAAIEERPTCRINWNLFTCQAATFSPPGKTAVEIEAEKRAVFLKTEAVRRATAWPTAFVKISKDMKNPNSIRIPFAQAPAISAKTRKLDGRRVCEGSLKTGKKSQQDKDVHIDRECCLDVDEVPNPRCYYPQLGANNSPERITDTNGKKYIK